MDRVEITIDYNLTADEFAALPQDYPTGNYHESENYKWYRLDIASPSGKVRLTWFLR